MKRLLVLIPALSSLLLAQVIPCSPFPADVTPSAFECLPEPESSSPCFGKTGGDAECIRVGRGVQIDREAAFYADAQWQYVIRTRPAQDAEEPCGPYGQINEDGWCYAAD